MTRLQPFFSTIEQSIGYLHLTEIQKIVRKELKGKSGIYGFLCKTNNKLYIGSSIDLSTRFNKHIKGFKSNILLQRAINKYNLQDFIFIIFEYCEPEEVISREQHFFDLLIPEFNILKTAGSSLGYTHTPETLAQISGENHHFYGKNHIPETLVLMSEINKGENNPMYNKIHSAETKALISEALTGKNNPNFGKIFSTETKAKMSEARLGKVHSAEAKAKMSLAKGGTIFVHDVHGSLLITFSSTREAGKYFNSSHSTISNYVKNGKLFQNQWIFSTNKDNSASS